MNCLLLFVIQSIIEQFVIHKLFKKSHEIFKRKS